MKNIKKFIKDEKAGAISIAGLYLAIAAAMLIFVFIDLYYLSNVYRYIKNQQDLANRAVYATLDLNQLAERKLYIDETAGKLKFEEYIRKNLQVKSNFYEIIEGDIIIKEFEIYNESELPAVTPEGKSINNITVHSKIEVNVKPIMFEPLTVRLSPYLTTDIPENLVKTFHP